MTDPAPSSATRPLVLVTLFGGGWHREIERILARIPADRFRFAYAYGYLGGVHGAAALPMPHPGERYAIRFLGPTRKSPWRFLSNPWRLAVSFVEAMRLVRRLRPNAVLALGTASSVPLFAAGRLFGARCVFVESLTRVERLSLTGRIVYRLRLADRVYVQWPHLAARLPRAAYAGAVV